MACARPPAHTRRRMTPASGQAPRMRARCDPPHTLVHVRLFVYCIEGFHAGRSFQSPTKTSPAELWSGSTLLYASSRGDAQGDWNGPCLCSMQDKPKNSRCATRISPIEADVAQETERREARADPCGKCRAGEDTHYQTGFTMSSRRCSRMANHPRPAK